MAADSSTYERVKVRLKMRLVDLLDGLSNGPQAAQQRQNLHDTLRQTLKGLPEDTRAPTLTDDEQDRMVQDVLNEVLGFGPLDQYLSDATISEIMVNGPSQIFIERNGKISRAPETFRDTNHLMSVIERMLGSVNLSVNETSPVCDGSLPDGSRINVIIPPLVLNGPVITIRRKSRDWTMQEFESVGTLSGQAADFLKACVKAKVNFVVSGGTSTGKTTLVAILSSFIPPEERIITIENVSELELAGRDHWIRMVAKGPNLQGRGEIPIRALVKNALRMRPDRIILGEARGGEALDVVQAMHSGHDGVITVLHANTGQAALERLETLMLMSGLDLPPDACRMQIASVVDLVVHLGRFADGSRRIATISQVLGGAGGAFQMEDLFVFEAEGFSADGQLRGACRYTGAKPKFLSKFHLNNVEVPSWVTQ